MSVTNHIIRPLTILLTVGLLITMIIPFATHAAPTQPSRPTGEPTMTAIHGVIVNRSLPYRKRRKATAIPTQVPTATPIQAPAVTATSTPTAVPTSQRSSPSGQPMPVGDLPGWKQIFTDDFTTDVLLGSFPDTAYGGRWEVYPDNTRDTAGQQGAPSRYYPSKVVSVSNGLLNEYLHTENGTPMAAAMLPILPGKTSAGQGQLYGKYTVRFKSDSLQGFKTAWLLWPDSGFWPGDGEIDFPEADLSSTIAAFMHHQGATSSNDQDAFNTNAFYTSWHTASIEWSPTNVKFILDNTIIGTSTNQIPNTSMHWVLQTESCLPSCPAPTTAGNLQIDWVVVYAPI